jgi:C4-dicarboxylate transporter, DctM subunit
MEALTIAVLLLSLLGLLVLGVPIGFALGIAGVASILTVGPQFLIQIPLTLNKSFSDVVLIAVPLFILMGEILYRGKVGQNLFDVANAWIGRLRGGTGMAAVFAFTFFAAIVGSSMASVLTIGKIAIPEMEQRGYSKRLAYGLTAVGGSLGILIPPSIPLILYASLSNASPGELFTAGFLPGLLIAVLLAGWAAWSAPAVARTKSFDLSAVVKSTMQAIPDLLLPFVVLGGIYAGIYTPTEAAAVGVVYALLLTVVIRRTLTLSDLPDVLVAAFKSNALLLTIVLGALLFGSALTLIGLPQLLADYSRDAQLSATAILLAFSLVWLVMGCFLEVISILLITVPVFFPIASAAGIDPIWFGIFMVINMEIGVITPPVGMNLFAIRAIVPKDSLETITRAAVPSISILITGLLLLWAFPSLALVLVGR